MSARRFKNIDVNNENKNYENIEHFTRLLGFFPKTNIFLYLTMPLLTLLSVSGEIATVVCDNEDKVKKLISTRKEAPTLRNVVVIGDVSDDTKSSAESAGLKLLSFEDALVRTIFARD